MTKPLSNHPPTPNTNPVGGEMRLLLECFNEWLVLYGIRTQKANRILEALGKESLKLADKDRAERQFEIEYLTDAMGEFPWRFSKDRNEWIAWNKTVVPYMRTREASLIEFARAKGLSRYPYPIKHATAGGSGNKATYEIISFEIKESPSLIQKEPNDMDRVTTETKGELLYQSPTKHRYSEESSPFPRKTIAFASLASIIIMVALLVYLKSQSIRLF
jgi:hypothetical protein